MAKMDIGGFKKSISKTTLDDCLVSTVASNLNKESISVTKEDIDSHDGYLKDMLRMSWGIVATDREIKLSVERTKTGRV